MVWGRQRLAGLPACRPAACAAACPPPCPPLPRAPQGGFKRTPEGEIDFREDFFSKGAFLTVSGQLQVRVRVAVNPVA